MKAKDFLLHQYTKTFIKIIVSAFCLWVLYQKINLPEIYASLQNADSLYLLAAGVFFIVSKILSTMRLHYYLRAVKIEINFRENLRLYWLGMFYNLFLPGGIGGDAYKAYYLNRQFKEAGVKSIITALLKDRLSGLILLTILLLIMAGVMENYFLSLKMVIVPGILLLLVVLYLIERLLRPSTTTYVFVTGFYSLSVQLTQLVSVLFIICSLGAFQETAALSFVFLISTIVVMLPITIGGIGLRELTFIYFAEYFHFSREVAVSVAFLFFLITTLLSFPGGYFHFYPEKLRK